MDYNTRNDDAFRPYARALEFERIHLLSARYRAAAPFDPDFARLARDLAYEQKKPADPLPGFLNRLAAALRRLRRAGRPLPRRHRPGAD